MLVETPWREEARKTRTERKLAPMDVGCAIVGALLNEFIYEHSTDGDNRI